MALNLDARQRAMLQEMGITVWVPSHPSPQAQAAAPVEAAAAVLPAAPAPRAQPPAPVAVAPREQRSAAPSSATAAQPTQPTGNSPFTLGRPRQAYPEAPVREGDAPWLVVVECAQEDAPFTAEAGQLLDNMLRALRLHDNGRVFIAPLVRGEATQACTLEAALAQTAPRLVLALGLSAARAVLPGHAPLGRLRASPQLTGNVPVVVTYDPAYLLRAPQAKAAAWADLCRAQAVATTPPRV